MIIKPTQDELERYSRHQQVSIKREFTERDTEIYVSTQNFFEKPKFSWGNTSKNICSLIIAGDIAKEQLPQHRMDPALIEAIMRHHNVPYNGEEYFRLDKEKIALLHPEAKGVKANIIRYKDNHALHITGWHDMSNTSADKDGTLYGIDTRNT